MMTAMSAPPAVDWHLNPQATTISVLAGVFTVVGGALTLLALFADFGILWITPSAVLLAVGLIGWMILAAMNWWTRESRNQMLTVVAAITQDDTEGS